MSTARAVESRESNKFPGSSLTYPRDLLGFLVPVSTDSDECKA